MRSNSSGKISMAFSFPPRTASFISSSDKRKRRAATRFRTSAQRTQRNSFILDPLCPFVTVVLGIELVGRDSVEPMDPFAGDRKSTRLNSSHGSISYAVFCLKKKIKNLNHLQT